MRRYLEGLPLPYFSVERVTANIGRHEVARVIVEEYASKGVIVSDEDSDVLENAQYLTNLDHNEVGTLLCNIDVVWHREKWPIRLLRMTRIYPPEHDPYNIHTLVEQVGKRFDQFAGRVLAYSEAIESDIGFKPQPKRDSLPIFGIKGKLHNHVIDGHHRTILALWEGKSSMDCLTAYRK